MKIIFRDKKISYNQYSPRKKKTIVFLHGFLENKEMWEDFANTLKDDFHVVTIDLPGHGKSDSIGPIHGMGSASDVVKAVLDHLKVKDFILVGHSMGGYISLTFADLFPDMVKGIVLFHSHGADDSAEVKRNRDRTIELIRESRAEFISRFIPDLFAPQNQEKFAELIDFQRAEAHQTSKEAIISALKGMRDRNSKLEFMKNTSIPILFVAGKQDSRIPVEKTLSQVQLPKHSELLLLDDCGHMGWAEQKEKTLETVKYFALKQYK